MDAEPHAIIEVRRFLAKTFLSNWQLNLIPNLCRILWWQVWKSIYISRNLLCLCSYRCADRIVSIGFPQGFGNNQNLSWFNTLNAELNPICYLLAILAYHFLHVSRIRVTSLTPRLLISYIYIYIYIYICMTLVA
jgi:hypothetical protein